MDPDTAKKPRATGRQAGRLDSAEEAAPEGRQGPATGLGNDVLIHFGKACLSHKCVLRESIVTG